MLQYKKTETEQPGSETKQDPDAINKPQGTTLSEPLVLLQKYQHFLENKSDDFAAILVRQRLLYILSLAIDKNQQIPPTLKLTPELTAFIQHINIKVMAESANGTGAMDFFQKLNLISKCLDLLMFKPVRNNIKPVQKLLQLRVLCFNNLSCIYKQNKQYDDALKSVDVALEIEQTLLQRNYQDTFKTISSTYINKCVILSELGKHEDAIRTIKTSLFNIQKYKETYGSSMSEKEALEVSYMTMFAYFNIAVEHEHLQLNQVAIKFYEAAFREAKNLGNWAIKNRIIAALKKLKNPPKSNQIK